jgi:hypothetical protein
VIVFRQIAAYGHFITADETLLILTFQARKEKKVDKKTKTDTLKETEIISSIF